MAMKIREILSFDTLKTIRRKRDPSALSRGIFFFLRSEFFLKEEKEWELKSNKILHTLNPVHLDDTK